MAEPAQSVTCPICGRRLMEFKVTDSRPTSSGQQRVQLRICPDHPQTRAATAVVPMCLETAIRFMSRVRKREKRELRRARKGPQDMVTG